ncbi:hypothetical protein BGW80DRAFT_1273776 [Lactifluus volemus]|nr:hypothetical protein BGW80DRAFT_1273776 [Lactifluus volemus]
MTWFDSCNDDYNNYQNAEPHQASLSHELIAGAASYEVPSPPFSKHLASLKLLLQAARAYERHRDANGAPQSHEQAKALVAGVVGAFVDREVETRGLDFIDRERAKREGKY